MAKKENNPDANVSYMKVLKDTIVSANCAALAMA